MKLVHAEEGEGEGARKSHASPHSHPDAGSQRQSSDASTNAQNPTAAVDRAAAASEDVDIKLFLARELQRMEEKRKEWDEERLCAVCAERPKDVVFECGHVTCSVCAQMLQQCHVCRQKIRKRTRFFYT